MAKFSYAWVVSLVIGAGVGWAIHGGAGVAAVDRAQAGVLATTHPPHAQWRPSGADGIDLAQLHAAIREELSAAPAAQSGRQRSNESAAKAQEPVSPELAAQRREALQEIEGMVASGEWGETERRSFQQKFSLLDSQQAQRALRQVLIGLNNGSIQATSNSPL